MILNRILKIIFSSRDRSEEALSALDEAHRLINLRQTEEASQILDGLPESERASAKALNLFGRVAFHRKEDDRAEEYFRAALAKEPENIEAHYGLSLLLYEEGNFKDAVLHAHYVQLHDKVNGRYAANAALCFLAVGDLAQAYWASRRAISLEPNIARYWNDYGIIHRFLGKFDDAEHYFRYALTLDPKLQPARENLSSLLNEKILASTTLQKDESRHQSSTDHLSLVDTDHIEPESMEWRIDDAEACFAISPDAPEIALKLALLLDGNGRSVEAIDVLTVALSHLPDNAVLRKLRGQLYSKMNQPRKATLDLLKALKKDPDDVELLSELGDIYANVNRFSDAIKFFERCSKISDKTEYKIILGNLYVSCCRYDEGIALYDNVLAAHPECAPSIDFGYGTALFSLGDFDRAKTFIDRTLAAMPYNSEARYTRASIHIMQGDYNSGWEDYRFRVFTDQQVSIRLLPMPLWERQEIRGKCVLLLAEQGLGDQVMFASIVPDLLALEPTQVIIEAHERIAKTITRSFPQCLVISSRQDAKFEWLNNLPKIDYYLPIAELARFFRKKIEDFPKHQGYLAADMVRVKFWKSRLDSLGPGIKVGISWRGGTERTRQAVRSLQLTDLAPVLQTASVRFVNLQYGQVKADLQAAKDVLGIEIAYWPDAIEDLDEFAALISALDLVITVCNTTVHFAGALNRPVWVMTPKIPEWRYGLSGSSMAWYPSALMFRQMHLFDWAQVIGDVKTALDEKLGLA